MHSIGVSRYTTRRIHEMPPGQASTTWILTSMQAFLARCSAAPRQTHRRGPVMSQHTPLSITTAWTVPTAPPPRPPPGPSISNCIKQKMACRPHLDSRCVLTSDPFGAGAKTRLESSIQKFKPHLIYDSCLFPGPWCTTMGRFHTWRRKVRRWKTTPSSARVDRWNTKGLTHRSAPIFRHVKHRSTVCFFVF